MVQQRWKWQADDDDSYEKLRKQETEGRETNSPPCEEAEADHASDTTKNTAFGKEACLNIIELISVKLLKLLVVFRLHTFFVIDMYFVGFFIT